MTSKALDAAQEACNESHKCNPKWDAYSDLQAGIITFLTHHLERPEAVARAMATEDVKPCTVSKDDWIDYLMLAKAALQCLIEDLT